MQSQPRYKTIDCRDGELHPLCYAAYFNEVEVVQALLDDNINPNCVSNGVTPLWLAAQQGSFEAAADLIFITK